MRKYIYSKGDYDDQFKEERHLALGPDHGKPIKIYPDGSIRATAFLDDSDDNMEFIETTHKNVYFQKNLNDKIKLIYLPKHWNVFYKIFYTGVFHLKKAFANFVGRVKRFKLFESGRYKHSHRALRREIKKLLKEGKRFLFTEERGFGVTAKPYIESTILGPYSTPFKVKTDLGIESINDLLIIKTGSHNSVAGTTENIVYISPHTLTSGAGAFYTSTGVKSADGTLPPTGQDVNAGIYSGPIYRITSNNFHIHAGEELSSYTNYSYYGHGQDEVRGYYGGKHPHLQDSLFFAIYPEHHAKLSPDPWDGIVPAGGYVKIESWSMNDQFIGFDGDLSIMPVDESLAENIDLTYEASESAIGKNYEDAKLHAERKATLKFYKKINQELVKLELKEEPSKLKKYNTMLDKVAVGIYGGINKHEREDSDIQLALNNPANEDFMFPYSQSISFDSLKEKVIISVGDGTNMLSDEATTTSTQTPDASGGTTGGTSGGSSGGTSGGSSGGTSSGY
jgi:hypothetical protein